MKNFLTVLLCSITLSVGAQFNQYSLELRGRLISDKDSDASFQSLSISKSIARIPIKKGAAGLLQISGDYSYAHINFKNNFGMFDDLENLHNVGLVVNYIRPMSKKWTFIGRVNPQLNSTFTDGIKGDDFYINVAALWNYSKTPMSRLTFGLAYTNTLGFPAPIPIISYWKKFNEQWEISLGVPRTSGTYNFSKKSSLIGYIEINGYNANISENIPASVSTTNGTQYAERIGYRDIITGLEYRYRVKKFMFRINSGYTLDRTFELQDGSNDNVFDFEMSNNLNIGFGLGYNFK